MDIWTVDKLQLVLLFAVPGFVSLKTYGTLVPSGHRQASQQLLDAVAYSCINYAILSVPLYLVRAWNLEQVHPRLYLAFWTFAILVAPVLWTLLYVKVRSSRYLQSIVPHPTEDAWHYLFSQRKSFWVVVSLQNGTKIAGRYDSQSFASSAPAPKQLYLQESWVLSDEGGFERVREDTGGILILDEAISTIELFTVQWERPNGDSQENQKR
jgi:hypothetical protein